MTATRPATTPTRVVPRWSLRTSFGLVVAAQACCSPAATCPRPVRDLRRPLGFGPGVVTLLFSSYVRGVDPGARPARPRSRDRAGRRPLLVAGIFAHDPQLRSVRRGHQRPWLFAGGDPLRHRQHAGHVVRVDCHPRAAPDAVMSPGRLAGRFGRHGSRHGARTLDEWTTAPGADAVADHISLRARHRSGLVPRRRVDADPRDTAARGQHNCTGSARSTSRRTSDQSSPAAEHRGRTGERSWSSVGCSACRRRSSTTSSTSASPDRRRGSVCARSRVHERRGRRLALRRRVRSPPHDARLGRRRRRHGRCLAASSFFGGRDHRSRAG